MAETKPTLLNLSLSDVAKITLQAALVIAVIVLWGALQTAQSDYRTLAQTCTPVFATSAPAP